MLKITALTEQDYDAALELWQSIPEIGIVPTFDTRERIAAYLKRNPELSSAAHQDGRLIGTLLCGHDGRRGSLYHMGVAPAYRGQQIARRLLERSLAGLAAVGIHTGFLFVAGDNLAAASFWQSLGWKPAEQICYYYATW